MRRWDSPRARWLADAVIVLVVGSALALPGLLWLLQSALGEALVSRGGGAVVLFLADERPTTSTRVEQSILPSGASTDLELLSATAARQAFAEFLGLEANAAMLDGLRIPPTLTVRLRPELDPAEGERLVAEWEALPEVESLWWDRQEQERSGVLYATARRLGLGLTLVLLAASWAVIAGSVAGQLERERPAVVVMTLLGASDAFILRPHLIHALLLGIVAAALGALLLSMGVDALSGPLTQLEIALGAPIQPPELGGAMLLLLFLGAPLLAAGTTVLVVRGQLRQMRQI
ncbi:MAG: FtsX-like permease family protein [Oceanococcaceae bacterium]